MGTFFGLKKSQPLRAIAMGSEIVARFLATHTPFVPQGVPPNLQAYFKLLLALGLKPSVRARPDGGNNWWLQA